MNSERAKELIILRQNGHSPPGWRTFTINYGVHTGDLRFKDGLHPDIEDGYTRRIVRISPVSDEIIIDLCAMTGKDYEFMKGLFEETSRYYWPSALREAEWLGSHPLHWTKDERAQYLEDCRRRWNPTASSQPG